MIGKTAISLAAFLALAGMTGTAQAQKAGTYSGTSQDGGAISMSVTGTGPYTITSMNVNFLANCQSTGDTANEGWGFYLGETINSSGTDFHSGNDYYDISGTLHFPNNNTIKGKITSLTAVFQPGHNPPNKAMFCKSNSQPFTLAFQAAPHLAPVQPGTAVVQQH